MELSEFTELIMTPFPNCVRGLGWLGLAPSASILNFFINLAGQLLSHCATTLHHQCTGIPQTGKDSSIIIICCQNAAKSRIRSTST